MRKIKNYVRGIIWRLLKMRTSLNSGAEVRINSDNDWFVYNEIFVNEEYKLAMDELLNSNADNPLILDLGANVGYFSLYAADKLISADKKEFSIYSFEASSINFKSLSGHVLQPLLEKNVKCWHGLIGQKSGNASLNTNTDHFGYSVGAPKTGSEIAEYIDLDAILKNDNRRIALMKCDIEGSEEVFIASYSVLLARTDIAVFEFHGNNCDIDKCRENLRQAGLQPHVRLNSDNNYNTVVELFVRK